MGDLSAVRFVYRYVVVLKVHRFLNCFKLITLVGCTSWMKGSRAQGLEFYLGFGLRV